MPAVSSSAPGKIILCGEHAVVYGKPAIAIPVLDLKTKCAIIARPNASDEDSTIVAPNIGLDSRISCLLEDHPIRAAIRLVLEELSISHLPVCEIRIHSTVPTSAGLGSSASTAVALVRALSEFLGHPFSNEVVNELAYEIEKIHHGTPSGIDNTVITYQSALYYQKEKPGEFLDQPCPITLVIADSGIKGSTAKAVADVRHGWHNNKVLFDKYFDDIEDLVHIVRQTLISADLKQMGQALTKNHEVLKNMGVSCDKLDKLVACALENGALGAKLSGGGQGGNMIALANDSDAILITEQLKLAGAVHSLITRFPAKG
jgi:mevalonate kinase